MWNFQRIICMWICCVSCMFGTTQLSSSLVRAVPYEYFDEHEQSFYDLDSEQIQAKYDTRLLSEQMLQTERQQHLKELKGLHGSESERRAGNRKSNDDGGGSAAAKAKLGNNDGHTLGLVGSDLEDNDDDDERKGWMEETATEAAAPTRTTAITESLDELHLPRAASCFTNGQKFTHGQKVPRLDSCEVCLCMDGEIFCWWEKCDKKSTKAFKTYNDYTAPFEESATSLTQLNGKAARKTTLMPIRKPKTNEDYKYDDDDSAEIREMQQEFGGINKQVMQSNKHAREQNQMHEIRQITRKTTHRQEKKESATCNKKLNEPMKKKKKQEEQQQTRKQHKIKEQHHHTPTYNNNRNTNDNSGPSGSNSKILNFPENLPSILYYDYKTEEHHQHQHQHREQHLKHQKQKQQQKLLLQQHEKEIKQQQKQHQSLVNRQHEYGQDFSVYSSHSLSQAAAGARTEGRAVAKVTTGSKSGDEEKLYGRFGNSSTTFKYSSNGNEHIYDEDLQTDSDILPEPPTNKPTFLKSLTETKAKSKTTEDAKTQFNRMPTSLTMATSDGTLTKLTTATGTTTNISPTASLLLKKQIFLPWGHNKPSRDKTSNSDKNGNGKTVSSDNNENNDSAEETIDAADQDDAFHRWLTSTEKNNKNNFTVSDAVIGKDDDDGDDEDDGDNDGGVGIRGLGAINNDYNVDERNYENTNWETAAADAMVETKTNAAMGPPAIKGEETTTITHAFNSPEEAEIYYENIHKPKYEQNLSENSSYSNNSNEMTTSSGTTALNNQTNHNNTPPLNSDLYKKNYMESNEKVVRGGVSTSTTSNEDNGVAGVVNIDIMVTASNADAQKQQQHQRQEEQPQQTNIETTKQQKSLLQLQDFNNEKQISKTQLKFIQPQILISNTNEIDSNNPLYSIINDNSRNLNTSSNNTTNMAGDSSDLKQRMQLPSVGVNLSSSKTIFNNTSASSQGLSNSNDSLKLSHITGAVPQTSATSAAATPPSRSTTFSPQRQCNVMGTLYKIGDVLPQDTGNCLQCICIDGSTSDDTPRVTCSPHNCPPLVLPDLFDATGY